MNISRLKKIIEDINNISSRIALEQIKILEVCGTHTHAIARLGIKKIINSKISLISGPGCPVCVTEEGYIDAAVKLSEEEKTILTFGDLMRVKGETTSLLEEKAKGRDIRVIYSVYDAITLAAGCKNKDFVLLAVGFETTSPLIAALVNEVIRLKIRNLYFLTSLKLMPPILEKLLKADGDNIHGVICPGNVAVVSGARNFRFLYEDYKIPSVICGFEEEDIILGVHFLVSTIEDKSIGKEEKSGFKNLYARAVKEYGNIKAKALIEKYFDLYSTIWRGIGLVKDSGLKLKEKYAYLDAVKKFHLESFIDNGYETYKKERGCKCSDVLMGKISPKECKLFGSLCTPRVPYGPCMVSTEGACSAYYKYEV